MTFVIEREGEAGVSRDDDGVGRLRGGRSVGLQVVARSR
jgi:hypothetical protein